MRCEAAVNQRASQVHRPQLIYLTPQRCNRARGLHEEECTRQTIARSSDVQASTTISCSMRRSRVRFDAGRFDLPIGSGNEETETEVASETEGDRTTYRLRETQFDQAPERVRLYETTFAAEAVELQRAQGAAAVLNRRQLANFDDVRQR